MFVKKYVLTWTPDETYFTGMTPHGPVFDKHLSDAHRYLSREAAETTQRQHWFLEMTDIKEIEEPVIKDGKKLKIPAASKPKQVLSRAEYLAQIDKLCLALSEMQINWDPDLIDDLKDHYLDRIENATAVLLNLFPQHMLKALGKAKYFDDEKLDPRVAESAKSN